MASILDMSASSDSEDDVDYMPPGIASDSSCDEELSDDEDFNSGDLNDKVTKKEQPKTDDKDAKSDSVAKVDENKRAKELWETFLNDVESSVTPRKSNPAVCDINNMIVIPSGENETKAPQQDITPVSKEIEFAGEAVSVKGGDANSCDSVAEKNSQTVSMDKSPSMSKKRGIDSVLGTIMNKNKKLTVLQKSKQDWNAFKKDEGLDNELEKFNKGRKGFIERQRFLERSDLRSFEKEKSMRQTLRKK